MNNTNNVQAYLRTIIPERRITRGTGLFGSPTVQAPTVDSMHIRWGSEEVFEAEVTARKSRAEAAYEACKRAFNDRVSGYRSL